MLAAYPHEPVAQLYKVSNFFIGGLRCTFNGEVRAGDGLFVLLNTEILEVI